jgi:hypothetical protein
MTLSVDAGGREGGGGRDVCHATQAEALGKREVWKK